MQFPGNYFCDRCGIPKTYLTLKGTNGMIAVEYDLCRSCFEEVKSLMLYRINRFKPEVADNG